MITFNQLVDVLDWYLISMSMANLMKKINWNNRSVDVRKTVERFVIIFIYIQKSRSWKLRLSYSWKPNRDLRILQCLRMSDYCFQYWMPQKIGPRTLICCNIVFVFKVIANYRAQLSWYIIRIWIHKKLKTNLLSYTVRKPNQYWNIF